MLERYLQSRRYERFKLIKDKPWANVRFGGLADIESKT